MNTKCIMVVDDDKAITAGLAKIIQTAFPSIGVLCYNGGREAQEAIDHILPDMLITDIEMPEVNGLALIAHTAGRFPSVVISGYDDFSYVQRALRFGVTDYLLKPIKSQDLIAVISKCINIRSLGETDTLSGILYNPDKQALFMGKLERWGTLNTQAKDAISSLLSLQEDRAVFLPFSICFFTKNPIKDADLMFKTARERGAVIFQRCQNNTIWFVACKVLAATINLAIRDFMQSHPSVRIHYAVPTEACLPEEIVQVEESNCQKMEKQYFDIPLKPITMISGEEILTNATNAAKVFDVKNLLYWLDGELHSLAWKHSSWDFMQKVLTNWYYALLEQIPLLIRITSKYKLTDNDFIASVGESATLSELIDASHRILTLYFNELTKLSSQRDAQMLRIKAYVCEHLGDSIKISDLADLVQMNSNYFSTVFKERTGQSFRDFLREARIRKAQELMRTTNLKLYEIALQVGYQDPAHFSRAFKEVVGSSPMAQSQKE